MAAFNIDVSEKLVEVRTSEVTSRPSIPFILGILFCLLLGGYVLVEVIPTIGSLVKARAFNFWNWLPILVALFFGISFVWQGFRRIFPAGESFVCDLDTLTIGHIPDFVLNGRWAFQSFPITSVQRLTWTALSTGRYGSTTGFTFQIDGKKKKTLWGLEAPEADQILRGLTKLGVDVVHDPGMPMIVEMALSRRKSRFGLLP